ncbi:MAG: serine acetyltransferase [Bacteroidetes bacterium]|nr:serine acetyltransferase [Bacteroidota bacterium]
MNLYKVLLVDIKVNKNNPKGRFIAVFYRIANNIKASKFILIQILGYPIRKIYQYLVIWVMGVEIPENTKIGYGLQIWHGTGLVINPEAVIGNNVLLRHNVTIGNKYLGSKCPVIGNNVEIGANTTIIGEVLIGDNVTIGANTFINKSVPNDSIVYGNPIRIIPKA